MNLDYALIRLSLALSNFQPLDLYHASKLVNTWLEPLDWVVRHLSWLTDTPLVGPIVGAVLVVPLEIVLVATGLVAFVLMVLAMLGSAVLAELFHALVPVLAHAIALGWDVMRFAGGH